MELHEEMNALRERSGASFRDLLSAVIASEAKRVEAEAQALAEEFYKESADVRATMPPSQHARYSVRVERRAAGVSIRWILIRFFGPKTDRKRFDKTVPRGGGATYPMTSFTEAQSWERAVISSLERWFGPLRSRSKMLAQISVLGANYQQTKEKARRDREEFDASLPDF
ncbi:conjugative transfer protein MobI(A/C) [Azospirillum argentinense]|nr:conjugative transfer protein MobI(A/C) [Azospirillum argentinense]